MKQIPWFKFCPADWMMGRISRQPAEVQVAFLRLCCVYWNSECEMSVDHAILESDGHLQRLLDVHLVESNGSSVFIKFLDLQWEEASLHRTKMSEAGRRSAERRSTKVEPTLNLPSTYVEPMLNLPSTDVQPMFNREEKRRGEKRREEDSVLFEQFWATYPRKTAKQAAVKAFVKLKESEQQEAISNIKRLFSNTPVEFVPHPATYINNKRWEDQTIVRGNTFANPLNQSNDNDLPIFR
jgi:hypothetical protein